MGNAAWHSASFGLDSLFHADSLPDQQQGSHISAAHGSYAFSGDQPGDMNPAQTNWPFLGNIDSYAGESEAIPGVQGQTRKQGNCTLKRAGDLLCFRFGVLTILRLPPLGSLAPQTQYSMIGQPAPNPSGFIHFDYRQEEMLRSLVLSSRQIAPSLPAIAVPAEEPAYQTTGYEDNYPLGDFDLRTLFDNGQGASWNPPTSSSTGTGLSGEPQPLGANDVLSDESCQSRNSPTLCTSSHI